MEWLNYHHLFYFWTVVRLGRITKACEELRLAPPTVSAQLRSLEDQLGEKLLKRSGRNLVPTEIGLAVYRQAEEIFSIGREIMDTVKQRPTHRPLRLVVDLDDVVTSPYSRASQEGFARKAKHQKTQSSGAKHSHLLERAALLTAIL